MIKIGDLVIFIDESDDGPYGYNENDMGIVIDIYDLYSELFSCEYKYAKVYWSKSHDCYSHQYCNLKVVSRKKK